MPRSQPNPTRAGLVLLVDDQAEVRQIAERILVRAGFAVQAVEAGADALAWLEDNAHRVDLVLSDFAMPGMNGRELLAEINRRWPGVRTMLMSGYTDDDLTRAVLRRTNMPFLAKPFGRDQLVTTISRVLARQAVADGWSG